MRGVPFLYDICVCQEGNECSDCEWEDEEETDSDENLDNNK